MNRQKRSRSKRAEKLGYQAGLNRRSSEDCPYEGSKVKELWLGGWREAREHLNLGYVR